jgi:predicted dehydrogenase
MPTRLALVGGAHIHTPNFVKRIQARTDVSVAYVWDHQPARAERWAAELGAAPVTDLAQIWDDAAIPAVIVCSETDRHRDLVLPAAAARANTCLSRSHWASAPPTPRRWRRPSTQPA